METLELTKRALNITIKQDNYGENPLKNKHHGKTLYKI